MYKAITNSREGPAAGRRGSNCNLFWAGIAADCMLRHNDHLDTSHFRSRTTLGLSKPGLSFHMSPPCPGSSTQEHAYGLRGFLACSRKLSRAERPGIAAIIESVSLGIHGVEIEVVQDGQIDAGTRVCHFCGAAH